MKITWDPKNRTETDLADKIHRHAVVKGDFKPQAKAYKVGRGDKPGKEMPQFDPKAGAALFVFP